MKAAIFCDSFAPENKAVAIRLFHFAQAFKRKGDEVSVYTGTRAGKSANGIKVVSTKMPPPSSEGSNLVRLVREIFLGVEFFIRIIFIRASVIILSSPPFFSCWIGSWAARLRGIPYVCDVRDEYPEVYFTAGLVRPESIFGKFFLAAERRIYLRSVLTITVTQNIVNRIKQKTNNQANVQLVQNGYDAEMFQPTNKVEGMFTVVFHGNIGKFQNPALLLRLAERAMQEGLDIRFRIIGWGNNDRTLKRQSLKNVEFLGQVDYSQIPTFIQNSQLGVSFRTHDLISRNSFPVKLFEYIGCGIPAIISPRSEAGDFFEQNGIGFQFDETEFDELYKKLVSLYQSPAQLTVLRNKVLNVRQEFSRQVQSDKFAETAHSILKGRSL